MFMDREDIGVVDTDPAVGAVLCGFDINLSG